VGPAKLRRPSARAGRAAARLAGLIGAVGLALLALPGAVLGHQLVGLFESPIPLPVYLAGAAAAVALSFAIVFVRDVRPFGPGDPRPRAVPGWLRAGLRLLGLIAVGWIVAQGIFGGASDGDVGVLFLWVFGWVGLALVSALVGPVWAWLDPFTTLFDAGAWIVRRLGIAGWAPAPYPARLGRAPAAAGYGAFVWLELIVTGGGGGRILVGAFLAYLALTLLGMAQFGRDAWRARAEVFSVWFGLLGRIAPIALAGIPEDGLVRRRSFGAGLLEPGWARADVALAALAVAGVLYDGLSQTQLWYDTVGLTGITGGTVTLAVFLGVAILLALGVARLVAGSSGPGIGIAAVGAGLVPIATGYIAGHYLTFLLIDGQKILIALGDPFLQGWNLGGLAFFTPNSAWLPPGLVWAVQLTAIVGGHMLGAVAGHAAAAQGLDARSKGALRSLRLRQMPLAVLMVALTATTLWSLGQSIVAVKPGG
jgi:hypothetical protein